MSITKSELAAQGGIRRVGATLSQISLAAFEAAVAKDQERKTQPAPSLPQKRYVVGIDPGVKTGFAIWDRKEKQFVSVETRDFWGVMIPLILDTENLLPDVAIRNTTAEIVVEVAHYAPVFRERKAKGLNENHAARLAQNVGQVMREAKLLAEGLRRCGYEVIEQKPLGKKGKAADDRAEFERVTGWTKQTSQHARDAARMAFQR